MKLKKGDKVWVNTFWYNSFEGTIQLSYYGIFGRKYLVKFISTGLDGRNRSSADTYYWWKLKLIK